MTPEQLDHSPLTFGKYKGKTPDDIADSDPKYLIWAYETVKPPPCSKTLYDACMQDMHDEDVGRDQEF